MQKTHRRRSNAHPWAPRKMAFPVTEKTDLGAQQDGHPGAQPYVGTGCPAIRGHSNVPSERPLIERERETRARDRKARGLVTFEARWPTAAADDRQRTAYAWEALSEAEEEAAIKGIAPFLENLKRLGRKGVPAGWKYLEEKRWTLLETEKSPTDKPRALMFAPDSAQARAIIAIHAVARVTPFRLQSGEISFLREVTPQLLAMAKAPPRENWPFIEERNQIGAWRGFVGNCVTRSIPTFVEERNGKSGVFAPWPWPPRKDGTLSDIAPDIGCSEDDLQELAKAR